LGAYRDKNAPGYANGGGWKWVTAEPWNYLDWGPGEPNGAAGGAEYLNMFPGGHWNDTLNEDNHGFGFVVEFEPK
jgi:hypothetical protein